MIFFKVISLTLCIKLLLESHNLAFLPESVIQSNSKPLFQSFFSIPSNAVSKFLNLDKDF